MYKIVIVEDELIAAEYLKRILIDNGFDVISVISSGEEAKRDIPRLAPDIVLMDIMLKDHISGSEVAMYLKQKASDIAIVFLSAYTEQEMINYAIESNAYGYLVKPYEEQQIITSLKIILSRIKRDRGDGLRRTTLENTLRIDEKHIFDFGTNRLFKEGREVSLGKKSLDLLESLCRCPNITVSIEQLCHKVWGEEKPATMLRTLVYRTKKEMGIDVIKNIKGLGYSIECM